MSAGGTSAAGQNDPYLYFRRNLLTPARVRELSRLQPARAVIDALGCWAVIIAAWAAVALWTSWWTVLLAIPVVGTRYYALYIIGHDGLHRRIFARTRFNDLFSDAFVFAPIGAITRLNNRNHLNHHQCLATPQDPDRHKHGAFNKTRGGDLLLFLTGASSLVRSVWNVFARGPRRESARRTRYSARDLLLVAVWQAGLIGGLSTAVGWWAWPTLWLFPVYVFAFLGDNARAFIEHSHPEPDELADHHRLVTVVSNPIERMFFAPMNMNFHAAHHLWPSIPYYNLPTADREMRAFPAANSLERRASYVGYLWRYYRLMPLDVCKATPARAT